jgi:hypothetical protein
MLRNGVGDLLVSAAGTCLAIAVSMPSVQVRQPMLDPFGSIKPLVDSLDELSMAMLVVVER